MRRTALKTKFLAIVALAAVALTMLGADELAVLFGAGAVVGLARRLDAAHDYEVNLKAELEIVALHEKIDSLREGQWAALVHMQEEQISLLKRLLDERNAAANE